MPYRYNAITGEFDLVLNGGAAASTQFDTDSGTAVPSLNILNVLGGTNVNTAGATNVVTINLDTTVTGLTSVEVGDLTLSGGTIATTATNNDITIDPHGSGNIILTTTAGGDIQLDNLSINSNILSSNNINGDITLTPDGTGVVHISYATQYAVPYFEASGEISEVGPLTNGQLVVGSTGVAPVAASLTGGTGITITNGAGSITIDVDGDVANSFPTDSGTATPSSGALTISGSGGIATSGSGSTVTIDGSVFQQFSWNETTVTGPTSMAVNNGYIANNAGTVGFTLPSTAAVGDIFRITGKGAGGWSLGQNAGQTIYFGSSATTTGAGGSLASTADRDTIEIVCVTANLEFNVLSSIGNITVI